MTMKTTLLEHCWKRAQFWLRAVPTDTKNTDTDRQTDM